jgi:protein-tyrosine phosphatase
MFRSPVIDLHCHVLPGIDDGPATIEGSLALARAAAAGGTQVLVATPHVSWHYRNDARTIARLVSELNERLAAEGVASADGTPVEVRTGAEVALTQLAEIEPAELDRLTLGGGGWLLVEPPFTPAAPHLDEIVLGLAREGRRAVIAHPERCPAFQRNPEMVARLVGEGFLTSVTAGSLDGRFGAPARRLALDLAHDGLLHNVTSDAHDHIQRPPSIAPELAGAGLVGLAAWLTDAVPRAVLDGGEIPPRPEVAADAIARAAPPRRWLRLRR